MRVALLALLFSFSFAATADAMSCRQWTRLDPAQRDATIDQMIQTTLSSSKARSYNVNTARMTQCLQRYSRSIQIDFDGLCAKGARTGMQALNNTFRNYVWSCAR